MAVKHGVLEMLTLVYFNDRPKKIGQSKLEVPSAFAKIFTAKNHRECFFVWNTDEYDSKIGKDPYTYKVDCKDVFSKWGTVVGKAEGWTPDNKIALEALLEKYIVTESNKSKTGIASSLLNALRSE